MTQLIERRPELALQVITNIMHSTNDLETLEHLAAGPLEDLLSENISSITGFVENQATSHAKFKTLMRQLWRNRMDDETWQRICAAREA